MANRGRPTQLKRERERARQERQKIKEARRFETKESRSNPSSGESGEDPDLAGITAGPQPLADWQVDLEEES